MANKQRKNTWNALDLRGQRFGRLVVVERAEKAKCGATRWHCRCDCGKHVVVQYSNLKNGFTQSCGCLNVENLIKRNYKHGGDCRPRAELLYRVWRGMIGRCNDPKNISFKDYGAKGVSICHEWMEYGIFREWALKNGYDESAARGKCTIDRIDTFGNYEPGNCRWVSMKIQNSNKRKETNGTIYNCLSEEPIRKETLE